MYSRVCVPMEPKMIDSRDGIPHHLPVDHMAQMPPISMPPHFQNVGIRCNCEEKIHNLQAEMFQQTLLMQKIVSYLYPSQTEEICINSHLPINSLQEMYRFGSQLVNPMFSDAFIKFLRAHRVSCLATVYQSVSTLLTDQFLASFSWDGTRSKRIILKEFPIFANYHYEHCCNDSMYRDQYNEAMKESILKARRKNNWSMQQAKRKHRLALQTLLSAAEQRHASSLMPRQPDAKN